VAQSRSGLHLDGRTWFANTGASAIGRIDPEAADPGSTVETFGDA
jgi:streptogramin lyase